VTRAVAASEDATGRHVRNRRADLVFEHYALFHHMSHSFE
jgi:ABC-type sulfate/molybdate transport systems ATPase subunit